jgi:membrane associated rhomboid family serine protease
MIFFLISIFYVIACDAVASIGETKNIGRDWSFVFSFLLTPILGYGITMLSNELDEDKVDSDIVYREILRNKNGDIFMFSLTRIVSTIIAINVMMFGFEVWLDMKGVISIMDSLTLHVGKQFHLWQLVTHQFLHSGVNHLYSNMVILLIVGPSVERKYGTVKTLLGYLIFGIAGGLLQMFMFGNPYDNMGGASGAVFGILTIFAITDNSHYLRFRKIKMKYFAIAVIILELFSLKLANDGIGHYAHFGGILAGLVFYLTQKRNGKEA